MIQFTSSRERFLWGAAAIVMLAILLTLGLASTLVEVLDAHGLLVAGFASGLGLVLVMIVVMGLKARPRGIELGVVIGIFLVYLLLFVRLGIPERSHLMEYSVVAMLVYEALSERIAQGRSVPFPALVAIGVTSVFGALDEFVQLFLPSRVFD